MQFCPCFDQTLLALRQRTVDHLDGVNAIDCNCVLIIGMEVRLMMRSTGFRIHTNDDAKEASDFWQSNTPRGGDWRKDSPILYTDCRCGAEGLPNGSELSRRRVAPRAAAGQAR